MRNQKEKEMKMELLEAIKSRKSIRAFKSDPVPKKVLTELLEVARRAPSGTNTQPWVFFVLTYFPDVVRRIADISESKQVIIGIAIGYPDWNHPLNNLRTDREPVEELVTWRGMAEEEEKKE
ncbi:Nitroreductase [Methanophagales archaeon]|nr:Nitroreductase [Methanophagales archaeon]